MTALNLNDRKHGPNILRDRPYGHQFDYAEAEARRRRREGDQRFLAALYRAAKAEGLLG